jgi:hypothetical protein
MDGLKIKVKTTDGFESTFALRPRIIVDFETKYQKGLGKLIAKHNGKVVKPWGADFLDTLEEVTLVTDPSSESTEIA